MSLRIDVNTRFLAWGPMGEPLFIQAPVIVDERSIKKACTAFYQARHFGMLSLNPSNLPSGFCPNKINYNCRMFRQIPPSLPRGYFSARGEYMKPLPPPMRPGKDDGYIVMKGKKCVPLVEDGERVLHFCNITPHPGT